MKIVKLGSKNVVLNKLDKMIMEENMRNQENLSSLSDLLLINTTKEDVFLFDNDNKTILISIDKKNRKEKYININDVRKVKSMTLSQFSSNELKFLVANI